MSRYRKNTNFRITHKIPSCVCSSNPFCKALRLLFLIGLTITAVSGCVQTQSADSQSKKKGPFRLPDPQPYSNILESSYCAADNLAKGLNFRDFTPDMPVLAASFVNIDNLDQSSTLGRVISEQIASRLAQQGFKIIETKLRQGSIFIQKGKGEFLLSRDLLNLTTNQGAQGVLVGTYAVSEHFIFISARVVRPKTAPLSRDTIMNSLKTKPPGQCSYGNFHPCPCSFRRSSFGSKTPEHP